MSCSVCCRSVVVICSRCTQHAVPKRETSKSTLTGLCICVYAPFSLILSIRFKVFNQSVVLFLQANPPPVVVNTDSVDTPPYVSTPLSNSLLHFQLILSSILYFPPKKTDMVKLK